MNKQLETYKAIFELSEKDECTTSKIKHGNFGTIDYLVGNDKEILPAQVQMADQKIDSEISTTINGHRAILNCSGYSPREMCFVFGAYHVVQYNHWIADRDGRAYIVDPATIEKLTK